MAFTKLLSLPTILLIIIASLDNADKQLLASSFPIFESLLNWSVKELGYFSVAANLSYALSLPAWGWLIHRCNGTIKLQQLLGYACAAWGLAMICIALVTLSDSKQPAQPAPQDDLSKVRQPHLQLLARAANGAALGSILPLSQSLLAEYVPTKYRGQAFGIMGACEKLAGTLSSAAVIYLGDTHWQYAYYTLGLISILMGISARYLGAFEGDLNDASNVSQKRLLKDVELGSPSSETLSLRQIIHRIVRLPAFVCLVSQGVFGGTPWDMMSYLLLLMGWRGFTSDQIVAIQFMQGISSMVGGWLGGVFGDYAAQKDGSRGRILVALVSVVGGIPLYGLFLHSTRFPVALVWITAFNLIANFTPAAAIRPICADLTNGPSERAQIVALWIVLEKTSGALFGAPLVGYLTDRMLERTGHMEQQENEQKAQALASNLFMLSSFFWGACSCCWAIMLVTITNTDTSRSTSFASPNRKGFRVLGP